MRSIIVALGIRIAPAATRSTQEEPPVRSAAPDPPTMRHLHAVFARQHRIRLDRGQAAGLIEANSGVTEDSTGIQVGHGSEASLVPWTEVWSVQVRSAPSRGARSPALVWKEGVSCLAWR